MPEQGDKKIYIGDVWADKDKYEYQKKFIEDVLEVHQHHGFGFDADMLDGFHATDFATAQQGLLAETALQPFNLGNTPINNNHSGTIYISTEAILLLSRTIENIPWTKFFDPNNPEGLTEDDYIPSDLTEAIEFLYKLLIGELQVLDDKKVDKACVTDENDVCVKNEDGTIRMKVLSDNNFEDHHKRTVEFLEDTDMMVEVDCYNCPAGRIEPAKKLMLNAGTINGLQFILITEHDYLELPQNCRDNWRNIFIFVEEYPPEYDSPLNCSFNNGFIFRVSPDGHYIQYKNKGNTTEEDWLNLIDMNDLFSAFWDKFSRDIKSTVINTINNEGDSISNAINELITQNTVIENMLTIDGMDEDKYNDIINHPEKYAFLPSSLIDDFVWTAYYYPEGKETNPKSYFTSTLNQPTNFSYKIKELNLTPLTTDYINRITAVNNLIPDNLKSTYNTLLNTTIPALNRRVGALERIDISGMNNRISTNATNITTINRTLSSLDSRVSALESAENARNQVRLRIVRWDDRHRWLEDRNLGASQININVYEEAVARTQGETDTNPGGFAIVIDHPEHSGGLSADLLKKLWIHVEIKGISTKPKNNNRNLELFYVWGGRPSNDADFGDGVRKFNVVDSKYHNVSYMTGKIPFRWIDVDSTANYKKAFYNIKATPYIRDNTPPCEGKICGNTAMSSLIITKPS